MRVMQVRELFLAITQKYFSGAKVVFSNQSRVQKQDLALVVLTPGAVKRPHTPETRQIDGQLTQSYPSRLSFTVDLYTHGLAMYATPEEAAECGVPAGTLIGYENSAMDDLMSFADYLNSQYTVDWCHANDVALVIDGEPQDTTGAVNDNNYEYRARMSVMFYFTQVAVGSAAVYLESSILYPDGTGGYTPVRPTETESTTGGYPTAAMEAESNAVVEPTYAQTSTGGGSEALASQETGYFTEVEIHEEETE